MCSTLDRRIGRPRGWRVARGPVLAVLGAGLAASAGCKQWSQPEPLNPTNGPIVTDEAMEARNWEQSHGYWTDSHLVAYPTRFPYTYESLAGYNKYTGIYADAPLFLYQTVRLPFTFIKHPPGARQGYSAVEYEPSYTVMPALNPESAPYHDPSQRSLIDKWYERRNAPSGGGADAGTGAGAAGGDATSGSPAATPGTPGRPAGEGTGPGSGAGTGTEPPAPAVPGGTVDQTGSGATPPARPPETPADPGGAAPPAGDAGT